MSPAISGPANNFISGSKASFSQVLESSAGLQYRPNYNLSLIHDTQSRYNNTLGTSTYANYHISGYPSSISQAPNLIGDETQHIERAISPAAPNFAMQELNEEATSRLDPNWTIPVDHSFSRFHSQYYIPSTHPSPDTILPMASRDAPWPANYTSSNFESLPLSSLDKEAMTLHMPAPASILRSNAPIATGSAIGTPNIENCPPPLKEPQKSKKRSKRKSLNKLLSPKKQHVASTTSKAAESLPRQTTYPIPTEELTKQTAVIDQTYDSHRIVAPNICQTTPTSQACASINLREAADIQSTSDSKTKATSEAQATNANTRPVSWPLTREIRKSMNTSLASIKKSLKDGLRVEPVS